MKAVIRKGGPGSGHHGHRGRPGLVGGGLPDTAPQASDFIVGDEELRDYDELLGYDQAALHAKYPRFSNLMIKLEAPIDDPTVKMHLDDLNMLPDNILNNLSENEIEIYISNKPVTEIDDAGDLKGVTPRGWPPGYTWDSVAGMYRSGYLLFGKGAGGSTSLALHEVGHAIYDNNLRAKNITMYKAFQAVYKTIPRPRLNPYYRQPQGVGMHELIAESFGSYYYRSRGFLIQQTNTEWALTFEEFVRSVE